MWTGKQALHSINQTLETVNNDVNRLDALLSELSQKQADNQRDQKHFFERLAQLRLQSLEAEPLQSQLSHADQMAIDFLNQRKSTLAALEKTIEESARLITNVEVERDHAATVLEELGQEVIHCEKRAQAQLEQNPAFQQQFAVSEKADKIADQAEHKTQIANEDRVQKGKPFESDSLFMYLWRKKYAQPEYKGGLIGRQLDKWLARLCHYHKNRPNYWMLLELPQRLALHAEIVRENAERERMALKEIEDQFAEKNGVFAAQSRYEEQRQKIAALDEQLDQVEDDYDQLLRRRHDFSTGQDNDYKSAINALTAVLQRKEIYALQTMAQQTPQRDDDHLISQLVDLRREASEYKITIDEHRVRQQRYLDKLHELKKVRKQFKRKRYDDIRSGFDNGNLISIALNEFLRGLLSNNDLWKVIERSQRHRDVGAWPDFGHGGMGRGHRRGGSTWQWPGGGSRNGGFRLPRSGGSSSRGRGGFRTGGGF